MKKSCRAKLAAIIAGLMLCPAAAHAAELSVEQAVALALEQNTGLKITRLGEETAKAGLLAARGKAALSLTASGGLRLSEENDEAQRRNGTASLTAKLPLFSGGKLIADIKQNKLEVKKSLLETERSRENIRLAVIQAYYDVLQAEKTMDVDQESVNNYQAHLTNVEQLYAAGSKAKIDVLRSSVALTNAEQTLIKAQNNYEVKISELKNILRLPRTEPLTLTDDFSYVQFNYEMSPCIDYALANRKDLLIDKYTLQQQKYAIRKARADYLPSLTLSAGIDGSHRYAPRPRDSGHGYEAGITASWSIFDSGVTHAAVKKAKTAYEIAELKVKKDEEDIDLAVQKAYYNMREAEKRFAATQAAVGEAEEDYYIASEKYRAGEGLMLDILDAQVALSTAQLNYISAQYDYARYKAEVENQMGIGIGETTEDAMSQTYNATKDTTQDFETKNDDGEKEVTP